MEPQVEDQKNKEGFWFNHLFQLEGARHIYKVKSQGLDVNLETMIPMETGESLEDASQRFMMYITDQGRTDYSSSNVMMALSQTHLLEVAKIMVLFGFMNGMKIFYGVMYMAMFDYFDQESYQKIYWAAGGLSLCLVANNFLVINGYSRVGELTLKMKNTLFYAVYCHLLSLQPHLLTGEIEGKVISVMTQFFNLMQDNGVYIFRTLLAPVSLIGLSALLVSRMGWFSLVGVVFCLLFEVIHFLFAEHNSHFLARSSEIKDKRMQVIAQILDSLKYIKMQMWENIFLRNAKEIRKEETKSQITYAAGLALETALGEGVNLASYLITLGAVSIGEAEMANYKIIEGVFLIMLIRNVISYVTTGITVYFQFTVVVQGVADMLNIRSIKTLSRLSEVVQEPLEEAGPGSVVVKLKDVYCSNGSCSRWDQMVLKNISLTVKKGDFVTLLGRVGSGKTTLLDCIAGQSTFSSGKLQVREEIGYVVEEPIIFSGTIKHNILMGKEMDEYLYIDTLRNSCLMEDLAEFQLGDQTQIQQKSWNISGGQRTRIALARALYSRNPILLLDDPLSTLDLRVGSRINQNLHYLSGAQGLTIIMATNSLSYLRERDRILFLSNGNIKEIKKKEVTKYCAFDDSISSMQAIDQLSKKRSAMMTRSYSIEFQAIALDIISDSEDSLDRKCDQEDKIRIGGHSVPVEPVNFLKLFIKYMFVSKVNWLLFPITLLWYLISQSLTTVSTYMLNQYNSKSEVGNKHFRNIYILIAVCIFVFTWVRDYFLNLCLYCSNKKLYKDAIHALVYASLKSFKNKNSGDSLDKFSQDLVVLDNNLSNIVNLELVMVFQCLSQIVQLSIVDPFLIIFGVLIVVVSYVCYEYCAPVIVAQRKLSLTLKGAPILDSFSEMIRNIKAVKIYKLQSLMKWETEKAMVNSGRAYMSYHKTLMAFQFYTQFLLLMVEIGLMFWMIRQTMGKNIGIFCSSMISLFGIYEYCDWILCNSIFISTLLASMERMDRFTQQKNSQRETYTEEEVRQEPSKMELILSREPSWKYAIDIQNLSLSYSSPEKPILRNINFKVKEGERIAIIGRTGSGKSSFVQTMYRLVEPDPATRYLLYGRNACELPLKELRSYFSFIPQFPFVFMHTIRKNVDPFEQFSDQEVEETLMDVEMLDKVNESKKGIFSSLELKEIELSFGERQLICIARILIKKSAIVIMDEATSNIDERTDKIIQSIIRKKLKGTTIITIAHKLSNILDYDRIIVLERGSILQQGSSKDLFMVKGLFYEMMALNEEERRSDLSSLSPRSSVLKISFQNDHH